jgi:hypothetical protein
MKQEIPTPVAIGLIVVVLAVLGFFVYRWMSGSPATISESEIPRFGGSGPMAPPPSASPAAPQGANPSPYQPPAGYGAPGGR